MSNNRLLHPVGRAMICLLAVLVALTLAGCKRSREATSVPAPETEPLESRPATTATAVIRPAEGGLVGLRDGAELSLPRQALSETAVVTLRAVDDAPAAPVPRSIIGRAYEFTLEGGSLTGVALLKLPLPPECTPDQYDLAPYRWNGRTWERLSGRWTGQSIQFGVSTPALFSIQGQWRLADATIVLHTPPLEVGRPTIPVIAKMEYRYAALPALQHDYIQARLVLKRDSSGGAGQVTGDPSLDHTVAEAVIWLKPETDRATGKIAVQHTFDLSPAQLDIPPGTTGRLYAILIVQDSAAPTRRFSTAIEYTQTLPIQVVGTEVVRPALPSETTPPLRWHVDLNGQPLVDQPADGLTLSLADILAQGGLGEYRITLEAQFEGRWLPVSNQVTVRLALPETPTPPAVATEPGRGELAIATGTAEAGAPEPEPSMPPTPTRRVPPGARTPAPGAEPSPTATSTPPPASPTATRPVWASVFWAERYTLAPGECTTLHWNVENVQAVYLNDSPTTGNESRTICPPQTTVYKLRTVSETGTQERTITIIVQAAGESAIEFTADDYEITRGKCTTLRWRVTNVRAVYLNGQGVAGEASQRICPENTTTYELRVEGENSTITSRKLNIVVRPADTIIMRFWAEQYTLRPGSCTTLHWSVEDVQAVYLQADGPEQGVAGIGTRQVCPVGNQFYTLRAVAGDGRSAQRALTLWGSEPTLQDGELIAQGLVRDVAFMSDIDPTQGGDQNGWRLLIEGLNPLFAAVAGCCQSVVTLDLPQWLTGESANYPVDWPISPGQLVEFRATCTGSTCLLQSNAVHYLRLRSD